MCKAGKYFTTLCTEPLIRLKRLMICSLYQKMGIPTIQWPYRVLYFSSFIVLSLFCFCLQPLVKLTSASRECLWLTSVLLIGASCCNVPRLLVNALVSLANLVHPVRQRKSKIISNQQIGLFICSQTHFSVQLLQQCSI